MKTTRLTLTKLWFNLIRKGTKTEEYREITPYYCSRLCANYDKKSPFCQNCAKDYCRPTPKVDAIHFTLGYPRDDQQDRHMICTVEEIRKGYGKILHGAPRHRCFIIKLGIVYYNGRD